MMKTRLITVLILYSVAAAEAGSKLHNLIAESLLPFLKIQFAIPLKNQTIMKYSNVSQRNDILNSNSNLTLGNKTL